MSVYIINALRTPIGSFGGQLACFRAPELGARVIKNLIEGRNLDLNSYDHINISFDFLSSFFNLTSHNVI